MVVVRPVDFKQKYEKETRQTRSRESLLPEGRKPDLSKLTFPEYIAHETKGRLYQVEGKVWEEFFENVIAIHEGKNPGKKWTKHLPNEQHPLRILYFRPDGSPLDTVTPNLQKHLETLYVVLTKGDKADYLQVEYKQYTNSDFMIGSGFAPYPDPPSSLLYPYRKFSLWLIVIGIVSYIFLPRRKSNPKALRYPLWRVVLGDVFALLMIVPFLIIPMFVVGGAKQALTEGWPLLIFFWPISLIGIWTLLKVSSWVAAYQVLLFDDRIQIATTKGQRDFFFKDMEYSQPVIFKPPRWLIILSWLAALSGKGATRMGATGRALMLSAAAYGSMGIGLKDGSSFYISITDQMGSTMLKGVENIAKKLKQSGVQEKKEVKEIRSFGFETIKLPEERK